MLSLGTLFGFISSLAIVFLSVRLALDNLGAVVDYKSIMIVVGGSAASTLISFPVRKIIYLLKVFFKRVLGLNKINYAQIVNDLAELNDAHLKGKNQFEQRYTRLPESFLKEAAEVLFWKEADIDHHQLRELIEQKAFTHYELGNNEAKIFKTMAKFPPAFGMMGTTLGMVALLQTLGGSDKSNIGPSMAVALITTLYGIAISNMFLIPIAENLKQRTDEDFRSMQIVIEGILLLEARAPTRFVRDKLNSYLSPEERAKS